eukprot:1794799-Prymnesium_polylepis.1
MGNTTWLTLLSVFTASWGGAPSRLPKSLSGQPLWVAVYGSMTPRGSFPCTTSVQLNIVNLCSGGRMHAKTAN